VSANSQHFVDQLIYFGGNLSGSPDVVEKRYQDLEEFVVSATLHMSDDVRVTHCFLTWLSFYGSLLSPSKMRRLLSSGIPFDSSILGALLGILREKSLRKSQWEILWPFVKKAKNRILFPELPEPRKNLNPYFKEVGILAHFLGPDPKKFLVTPSFVLKSCPEIRFRASDLDPVPADLLAYLEKEEPKTLYEVAKVTHHFRAQIYSHYRYLSHFGICDGRLLPKVSAA